MTVSYDFCKLANRSNDFSKKWDKDFVTKRYGELPADYISMWIADLDYELAPPIQARFQEILDNKSFGYIYAYDEFYQAIQQYLLLKTPRKITKAEIMLDCSIVNSIYHVMQAYVEPGAGVLIDTPVYNPYRDAAQRNGVKIIENKLTIGEDLRYHIDFDVLERTIKEQQPSVYILCSPHNPGGKVWSRNELERIAKLCLANDVVLVVDEAHSDHINQVAFTSILSLDEELLKTVVYLNSPNKPFNIAGLKTSYVVITDLKLRERYQRVLQKNNIDEPNVFGIAGLIAAYTPAGLEWNRQNYQYIQKNYQWVQGFMEKKLPELKLMPLDSTYVLWIDVSDLGMNGDLFTEGLAREAGVLIQEGSSFGKEGKDFVRINIGTSRDKVIEAFERIAKWVGKLKA